MMFVGRQRSALLLLFSLARKNNVTSFILPSSSSSFILSNKSTTLSIIAPTETRTMLNAKGGGKPKKKKKQRASASSSGGFGKVATTATKTTTNNPNEQQNNDYEAFPPLEDGVKESLLQSNSFLEQYHGDNLPDEILGRLEQIYGFTDFNYAEKMEGEGASMSFDELLSGTDSSSSSSTSQFDVSLKPSGGDDFSNLIASATGGETFTTSSSSSSSSTTTISEKGKQNLSNILSNLPPFSKIRILHLDPMVIAIDDFFTPEECDTYVNLCAKPKQKSVTSNHDVPMMSRSKTVGKDSLAEAQRTSTTWFHHFKTLPELMSKASRLLGLDGIDQWEEPQTVRYQSSEKFTWHLDALAPSDTLQQTGGQRIATLLVYLTSIGESNGGATVFRDLHPEEGKYLRVVPKKGTALLFFPAAGGIPNVPFDIRTLHAGEALGEDATDDKWVAQLWLRENGNYVPSAPPGNKHVDAREAIESYCSAQQC